MAVTNAINPSRGVADPTPIYDSIKPLWEKCRAVCSGERFVKDYDGTLDVNTFTNLLIPFSPSMNEKQYAFYKAEAELPGIVSQYSKTLVGGLLRKRPQVELPMDAPKGASEWILNTFGQDDAPLTSFLDGALWEEIQTSRAWVYVDYPKITAEELSSLTKEELQEEYKPYPVLWNAESIINWKVGKSLSGGVQLERVIVRQYEEEFTKDNEFHPKYYDVVYVHELVDRYYQIRVYKREIVNGTVFVVNGKLQQNYDSKSASKTGDFVLKDTITDILVQGERLRYIPAWPLNGSIGVTEPFLVNLVDREINLYNKVSRRNHLLYGAATYTPVISSNMEDEAFDAIVDSGLGSWIKIQQGDTADVLKTPTEALQDMEKSIAATIEEMARIGIRILSPETDQSGIALEIRNAAQTAQLGTLNAKISNQMSCIIAFMLNWRYGTQYKAEDIKFSMSADFNPTPLGSDWLRLVTEWYQQRLIPRSVWLQIAKANDMIPSEYDDVKGQEEITKDELTMPMGTASLDNNLNMMDKPNLKVVG